MASTTIYARASGPGIAGVAVLRISGPKAALAIETLSGGLPRPRYASLRHLREPDSGHILDQALVLWFPGPGSYTGEDLAEFHLHGGRAVLAGVEGVLEQLEGFRLADPGEFTRRAYQNGKMDLTEAEAVADLIAAETAHQRIQALGQLDGALERKYENWRQRLISLSAHVEIDIDFSDEDVPEDMSAFARGQLGALIEEIETHLDDNQRGERIRDGVEVVVLGPPNSGKSSFINALARRDVAIVSEEAGTTRDMIEVRLDLAGYPVTLVDTAGLRETANKVEAEGVRRARERGQSAAFQIMMFDGSSDEVIPLEFMQGGKENIWVFNKLDKGVGNIQSNALPGLRFQISVQEGAGLGDLMRELSQRIAREFEAQGDAPLTRARHRTALKACVESLKRAVDQQDEELLAEDLRLAAREIGRITGRVDVEDLLDVVFREFCIGK